MTIKEKLSNICSAAILDDVDVERILTDLPAHLQTMFDKADKERDLLPENKEGKLALQEYRIDRIGVLSNEKGGSASVPEISVLDMFAARGIPFSVGIKGNKSGMVSFTVGSNSAKDQMEGFLRTAYSLADISKAEPTEYYLSYYGSCRQIRLDPDSIEKGEADTPKANWLDAFARSAMGLVFDASMTFVPIEEDWIMQQLDSISSLLDDLSSFEKSSMQLSRSFGNAPVTIPSTLGNVGEVAGRLVKSKIQNNMSTNDSVSLELTCLHSLTGVYIEELQYRLKQLKQLKRDGGWAVALCIKTKKSDDASYLQSIFGGSLAKRGYKCSWDMKPCYGLAVSGLNLSDFVELPQQSYPGFIAEKVRQFEVNPPVITQEQAVVGLGNLIWNHQEINSQFQIPLISINRHAFICGMTGSGKSNTVCGMLSQLKRVYKIPFLVIEPVKGEYRSLKNEFPEINVFNLRAGSQNQLFFNPFWFPEGGQLQYHIDSLRAIFTSALGLYAAMPNILEQCLVSCYMKKGWKLASSKNIYENKLPKAQLYPTFSLLCKEIEEYLEKSDFKGESKGNYKGALLSRLQSFTFGTKAILFNQSGEPDYQKWIRESSSCIIELDALSDDADKAIVMGTLLSQYFQSLKCEITVGQTELRHIIVLEEAHHLLSEKTGPAAEGGVNARQQLVETLSNVLAEIRSYGEGVMIVDQSPTSVSPQVIKNTAIKIAHRVDYGEDLDILQHALLLKEDDTDAPAALNQGYALVRYGAMKLPVQVHVPLYEIKENADYELAGSEDTEDKGNLYWIIQSSEYAKGKLAADIGRFINDVLFNGFEQVKRSLGKLIACLQELLEEIGCSEAVVQGELTGNAFHFILMDGMLLYLTQTYDNHALLREQIQMMVERFIKISLEHEIKELEFSMLRAYAQGEIYPALAEFYRKQGGNARYFAESGSHRYLAGILNQMSKEYDSFSDEEKKSGIWSDKVGKAVLLQNSFLVIPEMLPDEKLVDALWEKFQYYLDAQG